MGQHNSHGSGDCIKRALASTAKDTYTKILTDSKCLTMLECQWKIN